MKTQQTSSLETTGTLIVLFISLPVIGCTFFIPVLRASSDQELKNI